MGRKLVIKEEYLFLLEAFNDSEKLSVFNALLAYFLNAEVIELPGPIGVILKQLKQDIDKRESISRKRAEAGKKGGQRKL